MVSAGALVPGPGARISILGRRGSPFWGFLCLLLCGKIEVSIVYRNRSDENAIKKN